MAPPAPDSTAVRTALWRAMHRRWFEWAQKGAAASGTPFATVFAPQEMLSLAREAGLKNVQHVSGVSLGQRYFAGRPDGLKPSSGEDFLVAST